MTDLQQKKPYFTRPAILLALILGISLGAGLLSTASLKASNPPAPLTFISPIGFPQLSLGKSVDNNAPTPGTQISYTLSYSNNQPGSQAFNVQLYDFLPAGAQFISSDPPATEYPNGVLLFTAPSVGPGTQTITAAVRIRVPEGHTQMVNHALIAADGVTPTFTSLLTNIVRPSSDWLHLVKTGPSAVLASGRLIYTLQATNLGSATLLDVTVIDVLPTGVSWGSAAPAPSLVTLPTVRWSLGSLNPAETKSIVITATAPNTTSLITNSAIAGAWQNVMTQTLLSTQLINNGAILSVVKTSSAPVVNVGDKLVYTLSYENIGDQTGTTVRLTDTLPSGLTVVGTSQPPASQTAQQLVWNLDTLNAGAQGQIVITTTVGGAGGRTLINTADITGQAGSFGHHAELSTTVSFIKQYLPVVLKAAAP